MLRAKQYMRLVSMLIAVLMMTAPTVPLAETALDAPERLIALRHLIEQNNYTQAFEYGQKLLPAWEGQIHFDFLYAVATVQTGRYETARFIFERLSQQFPNNLTYRFEYAKVNLWTYRIAAAEILFQTILESHPPKWMYRQSMLFLEQIRQLKNRQNTQWITSALLSAGYDSNINTGLAAQTIPKEDNILGRAILLDEHTQALPSSYTLLQSQLSLVSPLTQRTNLTSSIIGGTKRHLSNKEFNVSLLAGQLQLAYEEPGYQLDLNLDYQKFWLDDTGYLKQLMIMPRWFRKIDQWRAGIQSAITYLDYALDSYDAYQMLLALLFASNRPQAVSDAAQIFVRKQHTISREHAQNDFIAYGIKIKNTYNIQSAWPFYWTAQLERSQYSSQHPLYTKLRKDISLQFSAGWMVPFDPLFNLLLDFGFFMNKSNLTAYERRGIYIQASTTFNLKT